MDIVIPSCDPAISEAQVSSNDQDPTEMDTENDEKTRNPAPVSDPRPSLPPDLTKELLSECFEATRNIDMNGWAYGFGHDKGLQDYEVYKDSSIGAGTAAEVSDRKTAEENVTVQNNVGNYPRQNLKASETETALGDYLSPWDLEEMETKTHYLENDQADGDEILERRLGNNSTEIPSAKLKLSEDDVHVSENSSAPSDDGVHELRFEDSSSKVIKESTETIFNKMDWDWRDGVGSSNGTLNKSDYDVLSWPGSGWLDPNERIVTRPKTPPVIIKARLCVTKIKELIEEVQNMDGSFSSTSSSDAEPEIPSETALLLGILPKGNLKRIRKWRTSDECKESLFELGEGLGEGEKRMSRKRKIRVEPIESNYMVFGEINVNQENNPIAEKIRQPENTLGNIEQISQSETLEDIGETPKPGNNLDRTDDPHYNLDNIGIIPKLDNNLNSTSEIRTESDDLNSNGNGIIPQREIERDNFEKQNNLDNIEKIPHLTKLGLVSRYACNSIAIKQEINTPNTNAVIKKETLDDPNTKAYKNERSQIDLTRFRVLSTIFYTTAEAGFAGRLRVELLSGKSRKIKPLELLLPNDFIKDNASITNRTFARMDPAAASIFRCRLNNLPRKFSLIDILNAWEMSVSPEKCQ